VQELREGRELREGWNILPAKTEVDPAEPLHIAAAVVIGF
jgi:hypothetical protein